jgi:hypothetical protein
MNQEALIYPIGKLEIPELITNDMLENWVNDFYAFPSLLNMEVAGLSDDELNWRCRPGGWTIKELVHHLTDSHINGFIRQKLALTEDNPIIKPYDQDLFADTADSLQAPIKASLNIIDGLYCRWMYLLKSLSESDLQRTYVHPEYGHIYTIKWSIGNYTWHGNHHLAQIRQAKFFKGQFDKI